MPFYRTTVNQALSTSHSQSPCLRAGRHEIQNSLFLRPWWQLEIDLIKTGSSNRRTSSPDSYRGILQRNRGFFWPLWAKRWVIRMGRGI